MPTSLSTPSAFIRHDNHTPGLSFGLRNLGPACADFLFIRNTDSTNSAQISFDNAQGFTIRPGEIYSFELNNLRQYYTKALAGTPALEVILGSDR